jgi:hypothetical protein
MPGSSYDAESESWLSTDNPFVLEVLGASHNGSIVRIEEPTLHVSVPQDWWEEGTTVTVTGPGHESGTTLTSWDDGQPGGLSPHGVYPTYYHSLVLPDLEVGTGTDIIYDYNPDGDGSDTGAIHTYTIEYSGAFGIHMDASGLAVRTHGPALPVFAPYSHDADAPGGNGTIPEPTGLSFLGLLLIGRTLRRQERS